MVTMVVVVVVPLKSFLLRKLSKYIKSILTASSIYFIKQLNYFSKLREKLGLKPLTITDSNKPTTETKSKTGEIKKTYLDQDTNQEFEHVPAKNMSEAKEQKTLREKLREKREQRELNEKVLKSKGLGCSDDEEDKEDSAVAWLEKVKQKQEALKKAKLLEEMDEQFGISEAAETTKKPTISQRNYDSRHLKGIF